MDTYQQDMIDRAVDSLNLALEQDSAAINQLTKIGIPCNTKLAIEHPNIQVLERSDGTFVLRPIGLLNGVIGAMTGGAIEAELDESGKIIRFKQHNNQI